MVKTKKKNTNITSTDPRAIDLPQAEPTQSPEKIHYIGLHPSKPGYSDIVRRLETISTDIMSMHLSSCLQLVKLRDEIYQNSYDLNANEFTVLTDAIETYRKFLTENL